MSCSWFLNPDAIDYLYRRWARTHENWAFSFKAVSENGLTAELYRVLYLQKVGRIDFGREPDENMVEKIKAVLNRKSDFEKYEGLMSFKGIKESVSSMLLAATNPQDYGVVDKDVCFEFEVIPEGTESMRIKQRIDVLTLIRKIAQLTSRSVEVVCEAAWTHHQLSKTTNLEIKQQLDSILGTDEHQNGRCWSGPSCELSLDRPRHTDKLEEELLENYIKSHNLIGEPLSYGGRKFDFVTNCEVLEYKRFDPGFKELFVYPKLIEKMNRETNSIRLYKVVGPNLSRHSRMFMDKLSIRYEIDK